MENILSKSIIFKMAQAHGRMTLLHTILHYQEQH